MHTDRDSVKFPSVASQSHEKIGHPLTDDAGDRSGRRGERECSAETVDDTHALGDRARQQAPDRAQHGFLLEPAPVPGSKLRIGIDDALERNEGIGPAHR